jgi:hypothetical protein
MNNEIIENKNKLNNPNKINYIHFENEYLKYQKKISPRGSDDTRNSRYELEAYKLSSTSDEKISNINIKNDSMILYQEKLKKFQRKNRREFSASEIMMSSDKINDKNTDNYSYISMGKLKSKYPTSRAISSLNSNKFVNITKLKIGKKDKKKKVTFKKTFATIIDVESFKKYNSGNNVLNKTEKDNTKCTCSII